METAIIQITSGKGPAECERAAALALRELTREAAKAGFQYEVIGHRNGSENFTVVSVVIKIQGKHAGVFANSWQGVLQWICKSPFRKFHKRKNWFIGINVIDQSALPVWNEKDIEYKTMRSSGPGGQHVNKTESAVRATHVPSGLYVTASDTRSQTQNKKLATGRLKEQFMQWSLDSVRDSSQSEWLNHHQLERGNALRTYEGKGFIKIKTK
jgi:peptide chain release factor